MPPCLPAALPPDLLPPCLLASRMPRRPAYLPSTRNPSSHRRAYTLHPAPCTLCRIPNTDIFVTCFRLSPVVSSRQRTSTSPPFLLSTPLPRLHLRPPASVALWDIGGSMQQQQRLSAPLKFEHHREFVTGIDFNLFIQGQVASCAWDRQVCVWTLGTPPP